MTQLRYNISAFVGCPPCKKWANKDPTKQTDEYLEWYVQHEEHCMDNHMGSSAAMEAEGTSVLYHRSVEELGVCYNPRIADGDSKSHDRINREQPYGPDHPVKKEECVGHVQKRCGTNLINLTNKWKGM